MTRRNATTMPLQQARRCGLPRGLERDPYRETQKWPEPSVCPQCFASYEQGHWTWKDPTVGAEQHLCPACRRISDHVPAAFLTLRGSFLAEHASEVMRRITNLEMQTRQDHPLERLMAVHGQPELGEATLSFTGTHLAQTCARALLDGFKGELHTASGEGEGPLRLDWSRN
jgi:hypothetical protein